MLAQNVQITKCNIELVKFDLPLHHQEEYQLLHHDNQEVQGGVVKA